MRKKPTFAKLSHLLKELGFQTTRGARHVLFQHTPSDTLIVLKPYHPARSVHPTDLAVVRTMLDQRGLMEQAAFERALMNSET